MKLATDVTLLFLSVADNGIFANFFKSQLWTMKLTESTNTCHLLIDLPVQLKSI